MKHAVAMAIAAHPDDIEFMMSGTLLLLKEAGAEIHMWNLANGHCGTTQYDREEIIRRRWQEAQDSARVAGAAIYPPLEDDIAIFYEARLLKQVAARIREVQPDILLVPSPRDYMEDHANTSRLAVSGAFVRNMRNYVTDPPTPVWLGETVVYHALPYGLCDGLRQRLHPGQFVDVGAVLETKQTMLEQHRTQKDWLDESQGVGSYVAAMVEMAQTVGEMSGRFAYAEGWRRHSHLGFSGPEADPLTALLGENCWVDPAYEASLA